MGSVYIGVHNEKNYERIIKSFYKHQDAEEVNLDRKFLKKITPYSMTKHFKTSDINLSPRETPQPSPVPADQPPLTPRLTPEAVPAEPAQSPGARGHLGPNPEVPCPPSPGPQAEEQIPSPGCYEHGSCLHQHQR